MTYYVESLPNEFPFIVVTRPIIDRNNWTISFLTGTLVKDINIGEIEQEVPRYILSYDLMIGRVSLDFDVEKFRGTFMMFLGEYFRDLYRIHGIKEFEFSSTIIRAERDASAPGVILFHTTRLTNIYD